MSRRSLRLDGGLLDRRPPPSGSASLVVGGALWRSGGPRRSQRHSASCSESLLVGSPQKAVSQFLHNSSVNSVASDASLISSLLDESSIQESTLVETFWGLDQDADPRESTIIASESSTLIGSDSVCAKHSDQALSRVCCKDCDGPSVPKTNKETKTETSTIYYRGRKSREGCMFRWINRQWSHMSSSSRLSKLFIVLLLLLLFSLSWYRPAGIYSLLLGINIADIPGLSSVRSFLPLQSQSAEGAAEELVQSHSLSAEMLPQEAPSPAPPAGMDSEQLAQMEQSLRALWEGMEAAGRRAEESHKELLQLYTDLRQQASGPQRSEYDMELWMRGLMEQQLSLLRRRLNEERRLREQVGNATSNNQFNISAD
ncbi:SUN domain-containing protein 1-like isoform X2 [Poecilia latipinna]|uniref:SUN domain-containing protein 1-like isoform X2 n=1 Tax=Poecilia latipinna TaxID=48699 RepID=UPI00072E79B0|nr:PREDICTED: SUN domain-containing protein 1-like isoform X2 [Poecilia latipinna]